MIKKRSFWISLCLVNLCLVAFFGFTLRSKILFPLSFLDYRNVLSAHSHFAFAGWAGLALMTLLIYDLLPGTLSEKKIYQWILGGIEVSSLGMAFTFPFYGYNAASIFFSTLYIFVAFVFAFVFFKDVKRTNYPFVLKLLSISAVSSLLLSFLGTLGLVYILGSRSNDAILYRDSIYVFLHFQYNGFFTLSVFSLLLNYLVKKGIGIDKSARLFSVFLFLSVAPALFLSLLWHNNSLFYILAAIGCVLILIGLYYFLLFFRNLQKVQVFSSGLAGTFWLFAALSFALKMLLNVGTIFPQLGNEVYGDRPVIIGFLHLIFLGFLSFYILFTLIEDGYFSREGKVIAFPFLVFSTGIIANEFFLMVQGLGILFKTNSKAFPWLLWGAAILLFTGSVAIAISRLAAMQSENKKL
ncbi:MAG: hypothetical protein EOO14_03225 [Chitinophagaceae bacterium]|nr:MAG: hypothetical protein EOO14_03225 [Chitinophagaceae bacterium]